MKKGWILFSILLTLGTVSAQANPSDEFAVLCYHDVPKELNDDDFGVDRKSFVETLEYLLSHDYHFISMDDVIQARQGIKSLPPKAVMLTFDDAYKSFADFVLPLLESYQIPSVLAVVTHWFQEKPKSLKGYDLMSKEDLQKVAKSPLVEIASHSDNLHRGVLYNPKGNEAAAAANRIYDPEVNGYEDEANYRKRIFADLSRARKQYQEEFGLDVRTVAWPYGKYNRITIEEAKRAGFQYTLALNDKMAKVNKLDDVDRIIIQKNPSVIDLAKEFKKNFVSRDTLRVLQTDLDLVYDPDPEAMEQNLGRMLDRVADLKPEIVFLQAYADPDGSGNIRSVYFPNRVLPMRADLLNRAVHQLKTRVRVTVFAWMPVLSFVLPDVDRDAMRVWSFDGNQAGPSDSWYERLSPFHPEAREKIKMLYEDMAVHTFIDGVIFQDDAYLNDYEDFNPYAQEAYQNLLGKKVFLAKDLSESESTRWTDFKTDTLLSFTEELTETVRYHRPETRYARTFYSEVLTIPYSEAWYAQNYAKSLEVYDYVVVMSYPRMEKVKNAKKFFKQLTDYVKSHPQGLEKTLLKVQSFDWDRNEWIDSGTVRDWLRQISALGIRHIGYYPDDYTVNQPRADTIRTILSTEDFPFKVKEK